MSLWMVVFIATVCSIWHGLHLTAVPRSTQLCIPLESLNRVSALDGVRAEMSPLLGGR